MDFKDYYKVLGVTYDASQSSIERAYMRQLPTYMSPVNRLDELNEAYRVLHDVSRRTEYDNELKKRLNERDIALGNATSAVEYNSVLSAYPQSAPARPVEPSKDPGKVDPTKPVDPAKDPGKVDPTKPADPAKDPEKADPTTPAEPAKDPEKADPTKPADPAKDPEKDSKDKNPEKPEDKGKPEDEFDEIQKERMSDKKYRVVKTAAVAGAAVATGFFMLAVGGTVVAVAVAAGAVFGGFITSKIAKKIRKYSLKKDKRVKKISKIKTKETKLIEESNKRLEEQIDKLLSEPHNSYKLEASKIRYANEIELLKARIELKRTQKVKKGQLTKYKLELAALDMQLERANRNLKNIEQKISSYDKEENGLKRINDEIVKVQDKLDSIDPKDNKRAVSIKKLEIRKSALEKKQNKRAKGFKLVRKPVNAIKGIWFKGVDYLKGAVDVVRGNYSPEEEETENVKTR